MIAAALLLSAPLIGAPTRPNAQPAVDDPMVVSNDDLPVEPLTRSPEEAKALQRRQNAEKKRAKPTTTPPKGDPVKPRAGADPLRTGDTRTSATPCGAVLLAAFNPPSARLAAHLAEIVLRDAYGCAVSRENAGPAMVLSAIARAADAPLKHDTALIVAPAFGAPIPKSAKAARGAPIWGGADAAGWCAPGWFLKLNPQLKGLVDLPRAARRFGRRYPDGKGEIWVRPKHWPGHAADLALIDALGLRTRFRVRIPRSGAALMAAIDRAAAARRPWLGYCWAPSAMMAENKLGRLGLASSSGRVCPKACRAIVARTPAVTVFDPRLASRAPGVAAFLKRFSVPSDAAMAALTWRARANATFEETAHWLLERHPALWRRWIAPAARRRFEERLLMRSADTER